LGIIRTRKDVHQSGKAFILLDLLGDGLPRSSGGTTGYDPDGRKGINRFAALIVGGPFDFRDPLRFGPRRGQFNHFALDVEHIAGSYWHHPTQIVDAKSHKRMPSEWSDFNGKTHRHGGCVPSRCSEPFERSLLSGRFVQMERLRIEFASEPLNVFLGDQDLTAFETHPQR
jgi:hypothetical protein